VNYPAGESADVVDEIRAQWRRARPDVDTAVIDVVGRVLRAAALILRAGDELLARYELSRGEFDILSALRRTDGPQSPGALRTVSLASGPATTKRLHALVDRGLVTRAVNPDDGRGAFISLTRSGARLVDRVLPELLDVERGLIANVPRGERAALAGSLRRLLTGIES